jgi:hypothetical protein
MPRATKKQGTQMPHEPWLFFFRPIFRNQANPCFRAASPEPEIAEEDTKNQGMLLGSAKMVRGRGESG